MVRVPLIPTEGSRAQDLFAIRGPLGRGPWTRSPCYSMMVDIESMAKSSRQQVAWTKQSGCVYTRTMRAMQRTYNDRAMRIVLLPRLRSRPQIIISHNSLVYIRSNYCLQRTSKRLRRTACSKASAAKARIPRATGRKPRHQTN